MRQALLAEGSGRAPQGTDPGSGAAVTARPLRIIHVITRFLRAGAEENTTLSCNGQVALGHEVWLIHGDQAAPGALAALDPRVQVIALGDLRHPLAPFRDLRALIRLWQIFRLLRPDVMHSHTSKAGILARLAAAGAGVPLILHGVHILPFQGVSPLKSFVYKMSERAVAPLTHGFIAVSEALRGAGLAAGMGRAQDWHVVPSGMDLARFRDAAPPGDLPLHDGLLVLVASLERRKGQEGFLPVFARLAARRPGLRLALIGEGPERAALERAIARLGLEGKVILTGWRADVAGWIGAARLGLITSHHEGLPRVAVQYLAAGKPVVTTALPGISALIREGENGFICPVGDPAAMEAPLERLLRDPSLLARMGAAAGQADLRPWQAEAMTGQIEAIMQKALEKRRPGAAGSRSFRGQGLLPGEKG